MPKTKYANAFSIITNETETQIVFKLNTPIIDEQKKQVTGIDVKPVSDIRITQEVAKDLYRALKENFDITD